VTKSSEMNTSQKQILMNNNDDPNKQTNNGYDLPTGSPDTPRNVDKPENTWTSPSETRINMIAPEIETPLIKYNNKDALAFPVLHIGGPKREGGIQIPQEPISSRIDDALGSLGNDELRLALNLVNIRRILEKNAHSIDQNPGGTINTLQNNSTISYPSQQNTNPMQNSTSSATTPRVWSISYQVGCVVY
jgi:hypothetical protein